MYNIKYDKGYCKLEYNNIEFNGSYFESDNLYIFSNVEDNEFCTKYEDIKNMKISEIPNNTDFHLYLPDWICNIEEKQLKESFTPFNSIHLIKKNNTYYIELKTVYFSDVSSWSKKWDINIYLKELLIQSKKNQLLEVIEVDKTPINEGNFIVVFNDSESNTIVESIQNCLPLMKDIIDNTEDVLKGISLLKNVLKNWDENRNEDSEEFWQQFFIKHSWVISQCFSSPIFIFDDKAFIGGKNLSNVNGKIVDFIYKNKLTQNLVLIEIKTPTTKLIGKPYRGVFSMSDDLSGAVVQILQYKDKCQKNYYNLFCESNQDGKYFELFNPKCILLIGCVSSLNKDERQSFELYRNSLSATEVVTFDELFEKIKILLSVYDT